MISLSEGAGGKAPATVLNLSSMRLALLMSQSSGEHSTFGAIGLRVLALAWER
jgi:hypothetical protein